MQESVVFLVRVQRRCRESSRSLSHLLMSFLSDTCHMPRVDIVMGYSLHVLMYYSFISSVD